MTSHWISVYRHAARTHVVRNFTIVSTSRLEGRGGGGGYNFETFTQNGG